MTWRLHGSYCVAFSGDAACFTCVWWLQVHVATLDGFAGAFMACFVVECVVKDGRVTSVGSRMVQLQVQMSVR